MFRGECYRCHKDGELHAISMQCLACHEAEMAEFKRRMAEDGKYFAGWEQDRLDHLESCRWCAEAADTFGKIPPAYRCPRFIARVRSEEAKATTQEAA